MPLLRETKIGHWYFVVLCPACHCRDAISLAPSPSEMAVANSAAYQANCDCGANTAYDSDQIERRQACGISESGKNFICQFGPKA